MMDTHTPENVKPPTVSPAKPGDYPFYSARDSMQRDGAVLNMVLRIFLRVIEQSLQTHCPGAAQVDKAALHIGAGAFIHRFGSSLNEHVDFHVCVVDGVFEEVAGEADATSAAPDIMFQPASGIDQTAVAKVQADLRRRILRAFVGRDLIGQADAKEMLIYQHSGHFAPVPHRDPMVATEHSRGKCCGNGVDFVA